jgi:hypothetical protein
MAKAVYLLSLLLLCIYLIPQVWRFFFPSDQTSDRPKVALLIALVFGLFSAAEIYALLSRVREVRAWVATSNGRFHSDMEFSNFPGVLLPFLPAMIVLAAPIIRYTLWRRNHKRQSQP